MRVSEGRKVAGRPWAGLGISIVVALSIASLVWAAALPAGSPPRSVRLPPDAVILRASDIQDVGWGLRAEGDNGTGVWRLFSGHNEAVLAFLNVTLWVEDNATTAASTYATIAGRVGHTTQDGAAVGADASLFWTAGSGPYAGMLVRRYNVVFILSGYLESSWSLTRSDLDTWAGWQLARIEAAAS